MVPLVTGERDFDLISPYFTCRFRLDDTSRLILILGAAHSSQHPLQVMRTHFKVLLKERCGSDCVVSSVSTNATILPYFWQWPLNRPPYFLFCILTEYLTSSIFESFSSTSNFSTQTLITLLLGGKVIEILGYEF